MFLGEEWARFALGLDIWGGVISCLFFCGFCFTDWNILWYPSNAKLGVTFVSQTGAGHVGVTASILEGEDKMQAFPLEGIGSGDTGYTGSGLDGHLVGLPVRCVLAFTAAQWPRLFFWLANLYSRLLLGKLPCLMLPTWRQRESGVLRQLMSLVPGSSERPAWS